MATVNMSADVLADINDIYDKKEQASEISCLLQNLKVTCGWGAGYTRKLETVEYDNSGNRKVINGSEVCDELRKRLIQCAEEYYDEMLCMFESIKVDGEIFSNDNEE